MIHVTHCTYGTRDTIYFNLSASYTAERLRFHEAVNNWVEENKVPVSKPVETTGFGLIGKARSNTVFPYYLTEPMDGSLLLQLDPFFSEINRIHRRHSRT